MGKDGNAQTSRAGSKPKDAKGTTRSKSRATPAKKAASAPRTGRVRGAAAPDEVDGEAPAAGRASPTAALVEEILHDEAAPGRVAALAHDLLDEREKTSTQAARVMSELVSRKPELVVGQVERLAQGLESPNKRVAQTAAEALPAIAKIAPARVARHLDLLRGSFDRTTDAGRDGLVRTFANLCIASVAYQKRLEPVLTKALAMAEGRVLVEWTDVVLPALKGEPHARARAVVEERLPDLPRPTAQKIADQLGVKLRPAPK